MTAVQQTALSIYGNLVVQCGTALSYHNVQKLKVGGGKSNSKTPCTEQSRYQMTMDNTLISSSMNGKSMGGSGLQSDLDNRVI